tara:strand:+ start:3395 stop:4822 length:1428 start_codon:yes stop_codon:yes gene_type:complete
MAILPNYALKQLFENGDLLTQSSLYELIDATYNQTLVAGSNITLNTVTTPSGTTVTINGAASGGGGGTVTSVTAGTGISISGTTTVNPTVNVDYIGTGNVILAATDGTALTILSADRILLSAAVDNTAYYVNVSQLITAVGSTTASNGLTETSGDIKLGGTLTAATSIALDTHDLSFTGIGNVDIGLTYATGTAKTLLETGKDVLGLTALGAPNGVSGIGAMYIEDGADLLNSNSAMLLMGDLSELGYTGTGIITRVGDFNGNLPEAGIGIVTDSVAGAAYAELFTYGFNTEPSVVGLMAEHNADIAYSVASIAIGGPTGTKELVLSDSGWEILNDVDGDQYTFPWTSGTAGQVLADDGLGNHDLTWVDIPLTTPFVSLAYGANIAWAVDTGPSAQVILTGSTAVLDNPTGLLSGRTYNLIVKQSIGSGTLTYGSVFKWSGGTVPTLSTGMNAIDIFTFIYDGTNLYGSAINNFS